LWLRCRVGAWLAVPSTTSSRAATPFSSTRRAIPRFGVSLFAVNQKTPNFGLRHDGPHGNGIAAGRAGVGTRPCWRPPQSPLAARATGRFADPHVPGPHCPGHRLGESPGSSTPAILAVLAHPLKSLPGAGAVVARGKAHLHGAAGGLLRPHQDRGLHRSRHRLPGDPLADVALLFTEGAALGSTKRGTRYALVLVAVSGRALRRRQRPGPSRSSLPPSTSSCTWAARTSCWCRGPRSTCPS